MDVEESVRRVLNRRDPIGTADRVEDWDDNYIPQVLDLLRSGADESTIARHHWIIEHGWTDRRFGSWEQRLPIASEPRRLALPPKQSPQPSAGDPYRPDATRLAPRGARVARTRAFPRGTDVRRGGALEARPAIVRRPSSARAVRSHDAIMGSAINDQMGRHEPPFHRAARIGDLAALERLLTEGADVNARSDLATDHGPYLRGLTPLMLAAASNEGASVETLRWLLDHGADLRAESAGGVTAAWYAASGIPWWVQDPQSDAGHAERLRYLLDAGLSPHETSSNGRSLLGESARAGDPASVLLLLDRGVPPGPASTAEVSAQERGADGSLGVQPAHRRQDAPLSFVIPLFGAAESGSAQCVDLLLRRGSDPNVRDRGGSTPLMVAVTPDVVGRLVAGGADVNTTDASGDDVLGAFLRHSQDDPNPRLRRLDVARALLAAGAPLMRLGPFGSSRLNAAAFRLDGDAVEILLSLGVVPSPDSRGHQTPLHAVCWQNSYDQPERSAMIDRIVRVLAVAGNPLEARDEEGRTPLHEACGGDGGNAAAVAALLDLGADPEATDADDTTPLLVASWNGEVSCIQHLLAAGADPMRRGRDGKTALDAVRGHRDTWRELVAEAADDQVESYRPKLAEAEAALRLVESAVESRGR